ncbi:VOC family protein [Flavobacterium zepuense]|uniref:VOC family protein n=1 Tax=Flavobacterium zepuense TaxID=2593302 RepID=A0A552UZ76_9FLAO|nr:VOC family protein [Flavobacterium zepuense]TRW23511.1 VOC family protein [Flavobacterium zepuense]
MQKITPCLWFNGRVNEALELYKKVFSDFKVKQISHYGEAGPMEPGSIMTAVFEIFGQEFMILNGGPNYHFTEAVSFTIHCKDQHEVDHYWDGLTANGGQESQCGWLKDAFGLSWQIVPDALVELMTRKDPEKGQKVMQAMMQMKKIDIATLEQAYNS